MVKFEGVQFQSEKYIKQHYTIGGSTLRRWEAQGKITALRTSENGKRLYDTYQLQELLGKKDKEPPTKKKESVIYCRVSSPRQKEDLQRQITDLQSKFSDHRLISDIGSGLNFKRKGFLSLVDSVIKGDIEQVVVMHRDRLCRFGIDLLEHIFKEAGTKLVVYHQNEKEDLPAESSTTELSEDLIAITTFFVAKNNGERAATNRRRRKREADEIKEVEDISNKKAKENPQPMDGSSEVDLQ